MRKAFSVFVVIVFIAGLFYFISRRSGAELPRLGEVTDFELINQSGHTVNLESLKGKVWVGNLFFTSCPHICPAMTSEMVKVSREFLDREDLNFVSVSIDPQTDTRERLMEYAIKFRADIRKWHFLTGGMEEIKKIAVDSFKLATPDDMNLHSVRFVLVDKEGLIRGYYASNDRADMDRIINDIGKL